jgi:hypothetical protein
MERKEVMCTINRRFFVAILLFLFAVTTNAQAKYRPAINVGLLGGLSIGKIYGKDQTITSPLPFNYSFNKANKTKATFLMSLGAMFPLSTSKWNINIGLLSGYIFPHKTTGIITGINNYNFQYNVDSIPLLLESKLIYNVTNNFQVGVIIGAGGSWNRSQNYSEQGNPQRPLIYKDTTKLSFAYEAGINLGYFITKKKNTMVSLSYRIMNLGKAQINLIRGKIGPSPLSTNKIWSNVVLVGFSQFFDL